MAVINSITSKIDDANAVKSEKAGPINPGNPLHGRITFAVLSLVMICVLSAMLGSYSFSYLPCWNSPAKVDS